LAALDLSALSATDVEVLDLRNDAHTTLMLTDADVFAFNPGHSLVVHAETADTLELTGFAFVSSASTGTGSEHVYESTVQAQTVTLTVLTDTQFQPDILLFA
jgi:hypothetical protein